jgi:hypothetical protein
MSLVAAVLGVATATGKPVVKQPGIDVAGVERLEHRPLLVMHAGGPRWTPCADVKEPHQLIFTHGRFVLYEDGLLVFTRTTDTSCAEMEAHIGHERAVSLVDRIFGAGFDEIPRVSEAACSDAPGVSIQARRGVLWHRVAVEGLDRFGTSTCKARDPVDPRFTLLLHELTHFDTEGAVPFAPREVAIGLWSAEPYGDLAKRAVPWPAGLPRPDIPEGAKEVRQFYDPAFGPIAESAVTPFGNSFVVLDGKTWAYGYQADVLPEHDYLDRLFRVLEWQRP